MSNNDAMREMSGQIGELNGTLKTFAINQTKTNELLMQMLAKHEEADETKHSSIQKDISSLKTSRTLQRTLFGSTLLAGGGTAAKTGWWAKIVAAITAAGTAG